MNELLAERTSSPPDHLYIELTDRCNLHCKHCYLAASPGGEQVLDAEVVRRTLTDFAALGGYSVAFSGGEPLMHPEWQNIVIHAARLGLTCTVVTNGTRLDHHAVSTLVRHAVTVAVSVDGAQPQTHDAMRGRGNASRVWAALSRLAQAGAADRTIVCFTPTHQNLSEVNQLAEKLLHLGLNRLYISLLEERGRERSHQSELALSCADKVQLLTQLAFLKLRPELDIETVHLRFLYDRLLYGWDGSGDPIEGTLRIAPSGDVFLTAYVDDARFLLGNVYTNRLAECWASESLRRLFDEAEARRRGLPACQDCPYWLVCGGGSPARAFAAHGDMMTPDDLCQAKQVFIDSWFRANEFNEVYQAFS